MPFRLVAIGTSKGGFHALGRVLAGLPADFPVAVAVVQHRSREPEDALVRLLAQRCALPVVEAEDKMPLQPGRVHLAPSDYHLLVDGDHFALSMDEPVNFARPAIDVLFDSAADALGPALLGLVLTGTGQDGALGAARIKASGGCVMVEDPATSEEGAMPQAVLRSVAVDEVAGLGEVAAALTQRCMDMTSGRPHGT